MGNIFWQNNKIDETTRAKNLNQRGLVLWLTGLPGSGKSTIAAEVEAELARMGFISYILDGDNLRYGITSNLGFSKGDRYENVRRVSEIANLFCDARIITIVSAISPYEQARNQAREKIGSENFCEIYIKASFEMCKSRDPKGLYEKHSLAK